ncbi:60S ribosomal protein L39-like [Phacochoerus africanus]|uniref:60S ribosomal protein L39-like n=1 Tax=Phacochoerus africanus TaxID=41426 RepID=UPI001FDA4226|nr:60S ribosomal protein L39-like [Phacochoerus africanus]
MVCAHKSEKNFPASWGEGKEEFIEIRDIASTLLTTSSHKIFRIKQFLVKKQKQNHSIPQRIRMKTGNKIRYTSSRRHRRRTKSGL